MKVLALFLSLLFLGIARPTALAIEWNYQYRGQVLPSDEGWEAMTVGADAYAKTGEDGLTIHTLGSGQLPYWAKTIPWDLKDGFTLEWRAKIQQTEEGDGVGAAVFAIRYEEAGKPALLAVSLGEARIYTQNETFKQLTGDRFHNYRITVTPEHYRVYVDQNVLIEGPTPQGLAAAQEVTLQFGDHSPNDDARYIIEFLRWSSAGAFPPEKDKPAESTADSQPAQPWEEDGKNVITLPLPMEGGAAAVDGIINKDEYPLESTGFFDIKNGEFAAIQSRYFLRLDKDAIAIAIVSPQQHKPVATGERQDDIRVAIDDSVEIFLTQTAEGSDVHQLIINTEGVCYDQRNSNPDWNSQMKVANRVDGGFWTMEARITYRDLGWTAPTAESLWLINLCRTFAGEMPVQTSLAPCRHAYLSPHLFPYLRFSALMPKFSLFSIGDLLGGKLALRMEIAGAKEDVELSASLVDDKGVALKEERSVAGQGALAFNHDDLPKKGTVNVLANSKKEGVWYRSAFPFSEPSEPYDIVYLYVEEKGQFLVIGVEVPTFRLVQGEITGAVTVEAALVRDGQVARTQQAAAQAVTEIRLPLKDLPVGDYDVKVTAKDSGGDTVLHDTFRNYPPGPPPWLGNTIGISSKVPAPWTPVTRQDNTVSIWNRQITFSPEALFPTQFVSAGESLLATPITLRGKVDGKDVTFRASSQQWQTEAPEQIAREAKGQTAGITVETATRIEYDGFLWMDVTLTSNKETDLDELTLEIPMPAAAATLRNFGDYRMERTGAVPEGVSTKDLTERPIFWLGNEKAGIQWFAENLIGWRLAHRDRSLEVTRNGAEVIARLNVVDAPVKLKGTRKFSFGLMVTPVKPRRAENRSWRFRPTASDLPHTIFPWFTEWTSLKNHLDPAGLVPERIELLKALRATGVLTTPYLSLGTASPYTPEFKFYGEEWRKTPAARVVKTTAIDPQWRIWANRIVCNNSANYRDYFAEMVANILKKVEVDGFYFDFGTSRMCDNPLHGCGWQDEAGNQYQTFNVLGTRELARRMHQILRDYKSDSIIIQHMSGETDMAVHSFADILINGENFASALMTAPNYYHTLPLDKFRGEFIDQARGPVEVVLPQFERSMHIVSPEKLSFFDEPEGVRSTDHLIGLTLLHDTAVWPMDGVKPERLWAVENELGWDEKVVFFPYWEKEKFIAEMTPENPDVAVSAYQREGKTMLVTMNNTDEPVSLRVRIRPEWLGRKDGDWEDRYHQQDRYTMADGWLEIPLGPRMFRALLPAH